MLAPLHKTTFAIHQKTTVRPQNQPISIGFEHFQKRYNGTVYNTVRLLSYDYKQNNVYWTQVTPHFTFLYHIVK